MSRYLIISRALMFGKRGTGRMGSRAAAIAREAKQSCDI